LSFQRFDRFNGKGAGLDLLTDDVVGQLKPCARLLPATLPVIRSAGDKKYLQPGPRIRLKRQAQKSAGSSSEYIEKSEVHNIDGVSL
jgi:hypothetical protein